MSIYATLVGTVVLVAIFVLPFVLFTFGHTLVHYAMEYWPKRRVFSIISYIVAVPTLLFAGSASFVAFRVIFGLATTGSVILP